jgi:aminoglycoside phosphotransferase (APT) family kinase protein
MTDVERILAPLGPITSIQPITMGLSGAGVYAVTSGRGELVLRVQPERGDFPRQLRLLRRVAEAGVAPPIVHVDEEARATVSVRVAGVPLAAGLADPTQRDAVMASVVAQLRALHALDGTGVTVGDPVGFARGLLAAQRPRPGFPSWAADLEPLFAAVETLLERDPRRVVSHNDMNPGNILWDGARAWFVDWEVAGLNHPFYDLAAFAMFLRLEDAAAHALLAAQEQVPIDDDGRATFAALRRHVALMCGLMGLSLVPDLAILPEPAPTLASFYADLRAGKVTLRDPRGGAAFAVALLGVGLGRS